MGLGVFCKKCAIEGLIKIDKFTWDELLKASTSKRKAMWSSLKNEHPDMVEWWEDDEACREDVTCGYLSDGWCKYVNLPCGVNPYLTPRTGMTGMACMGMRPPQQISLF
jgi:hypothetical protein